ncbi:phosphoadenylylsulfate reductase (thioredoxin) [Bosea sp. OK403]|uniref:phosphoadenylyl-sulfate reductase n=1 Tax=Bosea sp. OK403 TaxID=1855286 RepID=UPI0008EA7865|nr:phosphoadenylyl-sulfate reductase [Bosea sp. OK403]SFI01785.1 phosphoadenylylsulfate reductase (thioredoxin) [Bosea sp. OK403]
MSADLLNAPGLPGQITASDAPAAGATLERRAQTLNEAFGAADVAARLTGAVAEARGRLVFTTSFGLEDQVLTHFIIDAGLPVEIVTLDTDRLFPEVHALWKETEAHFGVRILPFYPRHDAVEGFVSAHGLDGFYTSREARKACCDIRKVEPLGRALAGADIWITGLRADQSAARGGVRFAEAEAARGLIKLSPLLDWSRDRTLAFAKANGVPLNPLHEKGFVSIGCQPCTRAIRPGEPERAGRWWWEDDAAKECGLHVGPDGKLTRAKPASLGAGA